ncbi:MAG: ABC transporter ATP-binding protein [Actinomycetota bacterium]
MLEVADVRKAYGTLVALDGVSLDVAPGEIVALLGPNGAGKTTLVSIIAGLRSPDFGTVRVGGIDVLEDASLARQYLGLTPQEIAIYPTVTVRQNLVYFGRLADMRDKDLNNRIDEVGDALGLTGLLERKAHRLSGGEKRRLHSAIGLLHDPPLLLLDEPTAGADVETRRRLLEVVERAAARGTAVLYSTHYLTEVETLRASVAILLGGRLIARAPLGELVGAHATGAVELTFEGVAPALRVDGLRIETDGSVLRMFTESPAPALAKALAALGTQADALVSVDVLPPNLEAAFLALTGRRLAEEAGEPDKIDAVSA